jgi:glycosyltransferase involved in cell wall biosynthesis
MIRICHLITGLETGGAETMLLKLLSATDRDRFEPAVVSLMDKGTLGDRIEALGVPVDTLGMARGRPGLRALVRLARVVRRGRPQVLQGWMYHGNLAASLAARFAPGGAPVLWNVRQTLYGLSTEKPLTRAMIRLSARLSGSPAYIVYNSQRSAEQHEAAGFHSERRVIVPNGFDGQAFAVNALARQEARRALGLADADLAIGLAARAHPMKDHGNFLRAAALLAGMRPEARFLLAGTGVDPAHGELAARVRELGLEGRVQLLGEQRDMRSFYAALDLAALASAWGEGFPNVLGEAMAAGVPCVATDVGDAAAIVGDTGRIVPPRDPEALGGALAELATLGPSGRRALGTRARERVLARYALPAIAARYENLYRGALEQRG